MKLSILSYSAVVLTCISALNLPGHSGSLVKRDSFMKSVGSKVVRGIEKSFNLVRGPTIDSQLNVDAKLQSFKSLKEFVDFETVCNNKYTELLNQDPSQENTIKLQAEITRIKEKIARAKDAWELAHPPNNGGGQNPPPNNGGGQNPPPNNGGGQNPPPNNGGGQNPPPNNGGTTLADFLKVDQRIKDAKSAADFDILQNDLNNAYSQKLTTANAVALQQELTYLKDKIVKAKNAFVLGSQKRHLNLARIKRAIKSKFHHKRESWSINTNLNVDGKLPSFTSLQQFTDLTNDITKEYDRLVVADTDKSHITALQSEFNQLNTKISNARNTFELANPTKGETKPPTSGGGQTPPPSNGGNQSLQSYLKFDEKLNNAKSADDFNKLLNELNEAFQKLQTTANYQTLSTEFNTLKIKLSDAKNKAELANKKRTVDYEMIKRSAIKYFFN